MYVAEVPWAYPGSRFTKDFDLTVAWFASYLPRSTASYFMRVDWETVGRCVYRALHDLEPERSRRLNNLVNIGIDETSYKKGHKYITVIVNHDTNTVVWVSEGHGKSVLERSSFVIYSLSANASSGFIPTTQWSLSMILI